VRSKPRAPPETVIKEPWLCCRWKRLTRLTGWTIWSFRLGCHRSHRLQGTLVVGLRAPGRHSLRCRWTRFATVPVVSGDVQPAEMPSPVTLEVGRGLSFHLDLEVAEARSVSAVGRPETGGRRRMPAASILACSEVLVRSRLLGRAHGRSELFVPGRCHRPDQKGPVILALVSFKGCR